MAHDDDILTQDPLTPLNTSIIPENLTAVAIRDERAEKGIPVITAAGRGKFAEQILRLAYEHDIKVRSDKDLANLLAKLELDSPIPSEALMAVAEILTYVYQANGQPDPFNAIVFDDIDKET